MMRDRVIEGGMNIPVVYLPTTIVDGVVTSYVQARVENGVIYPPLESGEPSEEK